jgi:SAM-dependent methyltransferase
MTTETGTTAGVGRDRWTAAQSYEQGYWQAQADAIASGAATQLDWYRWRAEQLGQRLARLGLPVPGASSVVVEVGAGPVGLATYLPDATRTIVDPLNDFYGRNAVLSQLRDPAARYVTARGEELPVESATADLVIIENCIDHVENAEGVLQELRRILRPDGVLYLTVNCRCAPGYYVHRTLSRLKIDKGHPHTYTPERITAQLARHGFALRDLEVGSFAQAWREDLRGPGMKMRAKALLGVSEYLASIIAIRGR